MNQGEIQIEPAMENFPQAVFRSCFRDSGMRSEAITMNARSFQK